MVSTGCPTIFFRMARFTSMNSTDAGSFNFAAIVVLALTMTGSDVSAGRSDVGGPTFASITVAVDFFWAGLGLSRTAAVDRSSARAAMVGLTFVVAEWVLDDVGAGSTGRLAAILLKTAEPVWVRACSHAGLRQ